MKCPKCQTENPDSRRFCRECGDQLGLICPHCGSENLPGDKYCGSCGRDLRATTVPPSPASYTPKHLADQILTSRSALEGERKHVTALFSDLSGYTAMTEKLGPEEVKEIMARVFGSDRGSHLHMSFDLALGSASDQSFGILS